MRLFVTVALSAIAALSAATNPVLERQFGKTVKPYLAKNCVGCHSGKTPAASLDLAVYSNVEAVIRDYPRWSMVHDRVAAGEMPPKPMPQPPAEESRKVTEWITALRADELKKHAGDPGKVLARRLSNSEYNYTIRDLTGVDLKPTREFPVDPANLSGFDNSGESLTMSSALLKKYLQAARDVGDHMVLTQDGIDFAPHTMLSEPDRDKYPIQRIIHFYDEQPTDFAAYFEAAWKYKNRGQSKATLASIALESKVSPKYLQMVWGLLEGPPDVGPVGKLQAMWKALPGGDLHKGAVGMRDFVVRIRHHTAMQFAVPAVKGLPGGAQPLLNWKLRTFALHHRDSDPKALRNDTDPPPVEPKIPRYPGLHRDAAPRWAALMDKDRMNDQDLVVPAAERKRYEAAFSKFASVFPDTFYVRERGRYWPDDSQDRGRLLSAGYHNTMGYYRDDTALMELILDDEQQKHLDRLWDEFDYIADQTARTWVQYFFNQSGAVDGKGDEAGSPRPVGHEVTDRFVIYELRDKHLAKAAADPNADPIAAEAIGLHFERINSTLRRFEALRAAAPPKQLDALLQFAARAYRRPLTKIERDDILAYYHKMRDKDALPHEEAMRDSIVSILMSPHFLYLMDEQVSVRDKRALSPYALASRLSYFLWASMPDPELLRHAAAGDLSRSEVLTAQTHRMLKDPRVRDFATEFAGNWLDFRRFQNFNSVDRERFPMFTDALREAMFEEPVRFVEDMISNDRSILEALYGKYTFVNAVLAKHYGMPAPAEGWVRVDDATAYERGGLLPMSVFLTNTSPGLRTSPVKRGYWVVHRLLGETIPPPPAVVPELPHDEAKTDLPMRQVLENHRANPVCAGCHARFDGFGMAFEGYGPVGETRAKDLAGRPVDVSATLPGGLSAQGIAGVKDFIHEHREKNYSDGVARKLLAYALGRSLQLSDDGLIDRMMTSLASHGNRFQSMVETIVTSPQFLNKRAGQVD